MKMTENERNSSVNQTSTSYTSSTDSGVVIIDRTTTFNGNSATTTAASTDKEQHKARKLSDHCNQLDGGDKTNATKINIQNFINISQTANGNEPHDGHQLAAKPSSKNTSPTVSIRSTSISIVSIDENAIDSSIVDSDSDFEADAEGVHSNYIVKKLGQQTTYAANSPDIPDIGKGLTVLSQQVRPGTQGAAPLANNILNGGLSPGQSSVAPSTPQIGSIALTNSTDVTFGDKHFYEGPVTIQQFLIDSRDKWKPNDGDGQDNPIYCPDDEAKQSVSAELDPSNKTNTPPTHMQQPYKFIFNRKAVVITGVIIVLTILIGFLIIAASTIFKTTIRKNQDNDDEPFNGTLRFVTRDQWQARPAKAVLDKLKLPVHRVIISHTASDTCHDRTVCAFRLQVIQVFHMDSLRWDDIGYNFLIGADGRVYIGRGWDNQGAHTKGYNVDSVGISFVGTFTTVMPTDQQVAAAKLLIKEGVRLGKLLPDYKLYGARQMSGTESPGDALYRIIKTWPHWSEKI